MNDRHANWLAESPTGRSLGGMSHEQFIYDAAPALFSRRGGTGPLVVAVDTNVVIDITEKLELIDNFGAGVLQPERWGDPTIALGDLVAVWFWRDIRFFVPPSILGDAPEGRLNAERLRARSSAVEAFAADYWQRGGSELHGWNDEGEELERTVPTPLHEAQLRIEIAEGAHGRPGILPPGFDGSLVREALEEGCHAIVSRDRDITDLAGELRRIGLWTGSPGDLLRELLHGGEFSRGSAPRGPAPDLQTLATFYSVTAPVPSP